MRAAQQSDPDAALIQAIQAGDAEALAALYRRYVTPIYRYLRRRLPTTEAAEDLTSETFLAVVERIRSFRSDASFQTWVYTIARRRAADYWRKRYRLPEAAIEVTLALVGSPESAAADAGTAEPPPGRLQDVLRQLPERSRKVLESRFLEGRGVAETAAALNLSQANVKVIQHRALKQAAALAQSL